MTVHGGREHGMSRRRVGAITLAIIVALTYLAFAKDIPFTNGYTVTMYFDDVSNLKPRSPVRIAGVNVGQVKTVGRGDGSAQVKVVVEFKETALPVHADATARVRPRIFLEGNGFIDLNPGTPGAKELDDGDSLPAEQTATYTQLDQVLGAMRSDARDGLASIFTEIGTALNTVGTPEENADQLPEVREMTGGEALNHSVRYAPEGFKGGARIFDALIGEDPKDQVTILRGLRDFNTAINDREAQIVPMIADFATMMGAFAEDEQALQESTKQFSRLTYESYPTLKQLNVMLPELTKFANEIAPKMDKIPAMVDAAEPWIDENTKLLAEDELGTTARLARKTVQNFASASEESKATLKALNRTALCWSDIWEPTLTQAVPDGAHSSGKANYKEFWYMLVGWAGATQNFTGNGNYLRLASGSAADISSPSGKYFGKAALPQDGVRPARGSKSPPLRSDVPCYKNTPPNLAAAAGSN